MMQRELAEVTGLQYGPHTVTVTVVPRSNEMSSGLVSVDAFDVLHSSRAVDR